LLQQSLAKEVPVVSKKSMRYGNRPKKFWQIKTQAQPDNPAGR